MQPLITTEKVTFRYATEGGKSENALEDVSLAFYPGEFVAILGANGSGKTTLARHLNALLLPTSGKVFVRGLDTRERFNLKRIRQTVGMVFQHPEDQIVATTVEEDIAFGPENLGLPTSEIRRRVDEAIMAVGLEAHRQRSPHLLSAGQMQRLALAGVLAMRPDVVIFDEATTMLDPAGRRMAMELMQNLRADGVAVLFVTHDMEEAALADRVIVLNRGRVVFEGSPAEMFSHSQLDDWGLTLPPALALARRLRAFFPELPDVLTTPELLHHLPPNGQENQKIPEKLHNSAPVQEIQIEVEHLAHTYLAGTPMAHTALVDVNVRVKKGSSHAFIGVTGSGKSTALQHLNGILRPQQGRVRVANFDLTDPNTETREVTRVAGLVMQNPEMQFFEQYVGDEIAFGPRQMGVKENLAERVRWAMDLVGLDFEAFKDRLVFTLSGGEKRKVALASVLANRPEVLLLDEPTAGLDPLSHQQILEKLRHLSSEEGMTLVVSSHRMEDVALLSQEVTAFRKGRDVLQGTAQEVFMQNEHLVEIGLEAPIAAQVAQHLRESGWNLPTGIVTPEQLLISLEQIMEKRR